MKYFEDNSYSTGNTPLIRLHRMGKGVKATILLKIEGRNPAYSVKCRIGASMVHDAEREGTLRPGMTIVEPTSGNTGIALAFVAAARGYRLILTMPESMSVERRKVLKAFGAGLILTEATRGMKGAIDVAEALAASNPGKYYIPQQFQNPSNPLIHEKSTGPEIWNDTNGKVDMIVAGVGTGGTITGIARYLKSLRSDVKAIAVEPADSAVISQHLAGSPLRPGPHKIQGIGAGFIPSILDLSLIDGVVPISDDDAMDCARLLASSEGVLAGISGGAAVAAALQEARKSEMENKVIVVIIPDSGERYLSSSLFDSQFTEIEKATASDRIL